MVGGGYLEMCAERALRLPLGSVGKMAMIQQYHPQGMWKVVQCGSALFVQTKLFPASMCYLIPHLMKTCSLYNHSNDDLMDGGFVSTFP